MRVLLALILGLVIGGGVVWYLSSENARQQVRTAGQQVESATREAGDALHKKLQVMSLRPQDIKDELARGGQVVRRKTLEAGHAIADATADARTTAAIKAKLVADSKLSALSISVNSTAGVVTLSGFVDEPGDIGKAMVLAMEADGVREVVSTLQVRGAKK